MKFYSTNKKAPEASLKDAVLNGLAPDGGLYMPQNIPLLPTEFWEGIHDMPFHDIAFTIAQGLVSDSIEDDVLREIIRKALNFEAPLVPISDNISTIELFHGPTLAFKDFGARFMAQLLKHYVHEGDEPLNILVATSGDTGSAIASAFFQVPGIKVKILYPKGKVSEIQEKQLTTVGENVEALEIQGTFDDCQKLVKKAFADTELRKTVHMTSANSINIARLLPQTFYYAFAYAQLEQGSGDVVVAAPSGNFGNLVGGLIAKRMGLPITQFVGATNVNDVVPEYLETGKFRPRPSIMTISNSMDVGNPSNFARILDLYGDDVEKMRTDIHGLSFNDDETRQAITNVYNDTGYIMDPHGAVGYLALRAHLEKQGKAGTRGIFLETAHPAKFLDVVKPLINGEVPVPASLQEALNKEKQSTLLPKDYEALRAHLKLRRE